MRRSGARTSWKRLFDAASRRRWAGWGALALLGLLILAFLWRLTFSSLILGRGDTFLYFYPYWHAAAEALWQGRVPLWNPHIFMGAPFIANSQVGFFYPLNWPLWLLLPAPYAVSASVVLHVILAGVGTFILARRQLGLSATAALLAALAFALGGYLGAQVEHVNQLQGLAWLPWLLAVAGGGREAHSQRQLTLTVLSAGAILAMQLVAGHTQSAFISVTALLIFRVANGFPVKTKPRDTLSYVGNAGHWRDEVEADGWSARLLTAVGAPVVTVLVAGLLGTVQLLPTLELSRLSGRGGGLPVNEVVSFSLHPLTLPQALLPRYGEVVFTEYVAWAPLVVLLLAAAGAWQWRRAGTARGSLALAAGGLFLALGRFNLVYLLLAQAPGFSYFRAPARWLALYALGLALLAGLGLDVLRGVQGPTVSVRSRRALWWGTALIMGLIVLGFLAVPLGGVIRVGQEAPVVAPTWLQVGAWAVELAVALAILWRLPRAWEAQRRRLVPLVGLATVTVLFLASLTLPYNRLTDPSAHFDLRPPVARLQALQRCDLLLDQCVRPPGRLLSLSGIFFDPGDLVELETVYGDQLSREGFYDLIIAIKQKEIIAPNLPMAYGLASVDGFDGGVLPSRDYVTAMRLVLPENVAASDGRLREYLDAVPEARWLDLFGARYVITDKVGDMWRGDVFFDTQHAQVLAPGARAEIGHIPEFEATAVWLLADGQPGRVAVTTAAGAALELEPQAVEQGLWRVAFPDPLAPAGVAVRAGSERVLLQGLALVDEQDMTFRSLVPGNYRLIYSGDVKIYENLDVMPRAFLAHSWRWAPNVAESVRMMAREEFDARHEAVLVGDGAVQAGSGQADEARIVTYRAEEVVVETASEAPALLLLTDAYYPGWRATVDGEPVDVQQVDGLFRGVFVPAGEHEVRFVFVPWSFRLGLWITLGALLLWLSGLAAVMFRAGRGGQASAALQDHG